ncbi:hypothetical protein NB037_03045 [Rathayibacter sp. ZW T2_19]|uniref:Uncharacterized protein n=1 Tax=Rathayibacter rubneri TaxID=2950106 RepID=A0A9X2IT81_9MICO|nr:hypothetical protein [Rathayibacter rubneri]MCM6761384.1 hypothetical protein [Rathayibacter rubneri]
MSDLTPGPDHAASKPTVLETIAEYRKGIAGFLVPGLLILGASLLSSSDGGGGVTPSEWVAIVVAMLGTGITVTAVPNRSE